MFQGNAKYIIYIINIVLNVCCIKSNNITALCPSFSNGNIKVWYKYTDKKIDIFITLMHCEKWVCEPIPRF